MGVVVGDPLVDDVWLTTTWPRNSQGRCLLCDAPEYAHHSWDCPSTPIYASMDEAKSLQMLIGSFYAVTLSMFQTAIKCAECGKKRLAKDMDVIYQAAVPPVNPGSVFRYPHNIVKAVCPEHNRKGQPRWVHARG